jgi:two-component system sensor histidine kinase KdpD
MTRPAIRREPIEAAFVLPIGFAGMVLIGALTVAIHPSAAAVLALSAALVTGTALVAQPLAAAPLALIGWFTAAGFSHQPYGQLHAAGAVRAAIVLGAVATAAAGAGHLARSQQIAPDHEKRATLDAVTPFRARRGSAQVRRPAITRRRMLAGCALAATALPALTAILATAGSHLELVDDLLLYLLVVIGVTLVGGFWPAVLAAIAAGLLLNWFFTPPLHTWTIEAPQNILALLLFVTSAVTVSSVVHLAARRHAIATERNAEASTMLTLARTVLGGDDCPQAVLDHLTASLGLAAELRERSGDRWVRVAGTGNATHGSFHVVPAGTNLRLLVYGDTTAISPRLLDGYAAQAAAAFERARLRIQAGQAEALAEGNRMRTALLAAVSHDLRTPLASIKAAVSTLRQTDVVWTADDEAALLATIENGADRLDSLIGNLLDMSRIHTGSLQPFIRPTSLDEVAPLATRGLDGAERLRFDIPDALPLIDTDPGLLERALANLVANALRYSPADRPPTLTASAEDNTVVVLIVDHGPGIPVEQRAQVFEPFQQLGDRHTAGGVGLGLAVARGFIEAVGGRIEARSTSGGGLTMRIDLPAVITTQQAAGAAQ